MSNDEAEKAARDAVLEVMLETGLTLRNGEEEKLITWFLAGVEWERKTRHEKFEAMAKKVSESMRNLCTKYGTIQTLDGGRLIEDKEGGE